jgi:hypothetical protein
MCLEILFWYKHHFLPPEEKEKAIEVYQEINELNKIMTTKKKNEVALLDLENFSIALPELQGKKRD